MPDHGDDSPTTRTSDGPPPDDGELQTGTRVGTYTILETLGRGGMGLVYLAKDTQLHRKVALKSLLSRGRGGKDHRTKALREARTAAQINHPHVATIHEFLEVDDGAFIVMEYVEGQSLSAILRRDRLTPARVAALGRQLASGLAAAHAKGVVHRDLKPANIKLTDDGSVKILDFGVAGVTTAFTTVSSDSRTYDDSKAGQAGTPGYMSPEQLLSRRFDERTDIFSLGVVLFEMATGERAIPYIDTVQLIEAMARPLRRADEVDSRVPKALADVIGRAAELSPDRRFPSAAALGAALAEIERTLAETTDAARAAVSGPPRQLPRRLAQAGIAVGGSLVLLTTLGYLNSRTFNYALDRIPFADEGLADWVKWGWLAMVPVLIILLATIAFLAVLRVFRNVVVPISQRGAKLESAVQRRLGDTTRRLGMDNIAVRASWLILVIAIALLVTWWSFAPFITALLTPVSEATLNDLARLAPSAQGSQELYQKVLTGIIVFAAIAWFRAGRMLLRTGTAPNRGLFVGGCVVIFLALVSLQLPYRFFLRSAQFERVQWNGAPCYVLGEHKGDEVLLFCPSLTPRINRVSPASDPLARSGVFENVFTAFSQ